ncbi:MAG: histidine phosphatase family protein [Myxococcota bacterium]
MQLPFDPGSRRRIYLLRHADAAYGAEGGPSDIRLVPLTRLGREQAHGMARLLAEATIDRVVCSGLPRTHETAQIVIGPRELAIDVVPELEEVRHGTGSAPTREGTAQGRKFPARDLAYALWSAKEEGGSFLGGERFSDLWDRVIGAMDPLIAAADWSGMLLVGHGAVNRIILSWALGADHTSVPHIEQDPCCLNLIDVDVDPRGNVVRRMVRVLNLTAYDLPKTSQLLTWLELAAQRIREA